MRRLWAGALLAAVVAAAGCGGGNSDKKANEAYANSVCTAIASWEQQIKGLASVSSGISKSTLDSKVTQAENATKSLVDKLKTIPPPKSSEGTAAKEQLNQFTSSLSKTVDSAKSAIAQLGSNPSASTITAALVGLAPQVTKLTDDLRSTVDSLQAGASSLAQAFKNTDSCKSLG